MKRGTKGNVQVILIQREEKKHHICAEGSNFILAMNSKELKISKAVWVGINFTSTGFNYQGHNCF